MTKKNLITLLSVTVGVAAVTLVLALMLGGSSSNTASTHTMNDGTHMRGQMKATQNGSTTTESRKSGQNTMSNGQHMNANGTMPNGQHMNGQHTMSSGQHMN